LRSPALCAASCGAVLSYCEGMDRSLLAGDDARIRSRYELAETVTPDATADEPTVDTAGRLLDTGIEGVVYGRAVSNVDHRGSLTEVVNFDHGFWDEPIVYSYVITVSPGRIKGWGMHRKQADRYFVCLGNIRVVLFDGRVKSPTHGKFAEFHFSDASRGRLLIPPGVWHADQNWGDTEAVIINFPTRPYNREHPDKYRIDPESTEIPFDFRLRDG
jgi:dTDP-4-dehydrorhamnose 3,5-epimerase